MSYYKPRKIKAIIVDIEVISNCSCSKQRD